MRRVVLMIMVLGLAGLAACGAAGAGGSAGGAAGADLEGTSWLLTGIDTGEGAQPPAGDGEAAFSFAQGRLSGSAGCNQLGGSYTLDGETISVGPLMSTKMACPEPLMQQEQAVSAILTGAERAVVTGDTLTISAADGRSLIFSRS